MLLEEQIREVYHYQLEYLQRIQSGIPRTLSHSINLQASHIQIISGIRRCGKSTLLRQLAAKIPSLSMISFEDPRLVRFDVNDFFKLEKIFRETDPSGVFFLDEIQQVPEWEKFIRVMHDKGTRVLISGSNASMLSRELGTRLTGRQISHVLYPFSYPEFLTYTGRNPGAESWLTFLRSGGFPEYLASEDPDVHGSLYHDLINRDIIVRHGLRNAQVVKEMGVYLATNTGKLLSYNGLARHFGLGSVNTAQSYLGYFEDAYLFFSLPFFSYSLKQQAVNPKKIYGIDTGLMHALSLSFSQDLGRLQENAVYTELKHRDYQLSYFKGIHECDFVCVRNRKVEQLIQVCLDLNTDNLDRELAGLHEAMDATNVSTGLILTLDQEERMIHGDKTVEVLPAWKWGS